MTNSNVFGETYKSDYEIAQQREAGVKKELALAVSQSQATDAKSVTLRELQSTAQTYKTIYDNFLQRYMEAVQQQSFPITESRLISSASGRWVRAVLKLFAYLVGYMFRRDVSWFRNWDIAGFVGPSFSQQRTG